MTQHELTETDLLEFVDRCCSASDAERIEEHIAGCAACSETVRMFGIWRSRLIDAAAEFRESVSIPEDRLNQMLAESRIHIAQMETAAEWTPAQAVVLLRSVLEPFCGIGTAKAAVSIALRRSTSGNLDRSCWRLFVENLAESVESICGKAAGRLVGQAGDTLAIWGPG